MTEPIDPWTFCMCCGAYLTGSMTQHKPDCKIKELIDRARAGVLMTPTEVIESKLKNRRLVSAVMLDDGWTLLTFECGHAVQVITACYFGELYTYPCPCAECINDLLATLRQERQI